MKSKKIIASITAMSVMAMSSLSFAAVTIKDSNITTFTNNKSGANVKFEGNTQVGTIVSNANLSLTAEGAARTNLANTAVQVISGTANLGSVQFGSVSATTPGDVSGTATDQEIETIPAQ